MNWIMQVWTMLRAQRRRKRERERGLRAAKWLASLSTAPTSFVANVADRGFKSDARRRLNDLQKRLN